MVNIREENHYYDDSVDGLMMVMLMITVKSTVTMMMMMMVMMMMQMMTMTMMMIRTMIIKLARVTRLLNVHNHEYYHEHDCCHDAHDNGDDDY